MLVDKVNLGIYPSKLNFSRLCRGEKRGTLWHLRFLAKGDCHQLFKGRRSPSLRERVVGGGGA